MSIVRAGQTRGRTSGICHFFFMTTGEKIKTNDCNIYIISIIDRFGFLQFYFETILVPNAAPEQISVTVCNLTGISLILYMYLPMCLKILRLQYMCSERLIFICIYLVQVYIDYLP